MNKKIEKLTAEQEAMLPIIRDQWVNKLGNISLNKTEVLEGLDYLYSKINKTRPELVVWVESPLAMQYTYHMMRAIFQNLKITPGNSVGDSVMDSVMDSVENSVWNSVWNLVGDSVWNSVENSVWNSVWNLVGDSVGGSVKNSVENSVWNLVENSVENSVKNSVRNSVWNSVENSVWNSVWNLVENSVGGSVRNSVWNSVGNSVKNSVENYQVMGNTGSIWWWGWFAWVDYYRRILGLKFKEDNEIDQLMKLQLTYDFLLYDNLVIVCNHPKVLYRNDEGQLHADGKPAIEWEDGYKLYRLNGVEVEEYLAMTPAGNLDINYYHKLTNADVKAEFLRKYGIDRLSDQGVVIDSYKNYKNLNPLWVDSQYELIDMAPIHEGLDKALYLKMKNLTVKGLYHMEGVSNDCKTINDALQDRWEENVNEYTTIAIK